jgi:hypothetical protein
MVLDQFIHIMVQQNMLKPMDQFILPSPDQLSQANKLNTIYLPTYLQTTKLM